LYIRHSYKFDKEIKIIHPGEFYVSSKDELIGTLLGSCISVCLFDRVKKISGMNHFMLPGRISLNDIFKDKSARYGITAINQLLSAMFNIGADKSSLEAKIFGGGHVLESNNTITIPSDNIKLARVMMEFEDIPIEKSDVGMTFTRKLLMDVVTGKVYMKRTSRKEVIEDVEKRDTEFAKRSFSGG
jgi:chemotaxis protein CheD